MFKKIFIHSAYTYMLSNLHLLVSLNPSLRRLSTGRLSAVETK